MSDLGMLSGFDHDALHAPLGIGDIITLLPDGRNLNGIVSFSSVRGLDSPQAWVQVLPDTVQMPQNITDSRFRLVPRLQRKSSLFAGHALRLRKDAADTVLLVLPDAEKDALAKLEKDHARKESNQPANEVWHSGSKPATAATPRLLQTPSGPTHSAQTDLELEIAQQRESCEGISSVQAQRARSALPLCVSLSHLFGFVMLY